MLITAEITSHAKKMFDIIYVPNVSVGCLVQIQTDAFVNIA